MGVDPHHDRRIVSDSGGHNVNRNTCGQLLRDVPVTKAMETQPLVMPAFVQASLNRLVRFPGLNGTALAFHGRDVPVVRILVLPEGFSLLLAS